jgi:hypothetical protein
LAFFQSLLSLLLLVLICLVTFPKVFELQSFS